MSGVLKAADVNRDHLMALIRDLQRAGDGPQTRCWLEAPDGWSFDWWPGLDGGVNWCRAAHDPAPLPAKGTVERSTAGRLFDPDGEFRWRHIPALGASCYRCVFLGKVDWVGLKLDDQSAQLTGLSAERNKQLLWGQQTDVWPGEWIELRIPHRFRYPIDGDPHGVRIETEQWCDATRQPHFIRLCDLHPYPETA